MLFDDDGRIYAVFEYGDVKMIEFKPDLSGVIEGSERIIIPRGHAMGEGHHFYKIHGKYYLISADYDDAALMHGCRTEFIVARLRHLKLRTRPRNRRTLAHVATPPAALRTHGFRVLDRGQGRVALEATDGSGFVTVVGLGLSGDVRLSKTETEGSLFQWQDMLRGQCMLLSLKTHRYVALDPLTGEPYSAESPGARPDRKDGAVLVWKEVQPE